MDSLVLAADRPALKRISLTVTQDTLCPWCYIGWKEMETAIIAAQHAGLPLKFDVEFKPFRLDATLPASYPVDKNQMYLTKFGPERFATIKHMLNQRGEPLDIYFNFEGPIRRSGACHRLLRYAYHKQRELLIGECVPMQTCMKNDLQSKLANMIFAGFFENGDDIADHEVLAGYAQKVGLASREEALAFLASSAYRDEVEDLIDSAAQRGVTGVPHTVINNKWAIVGGQTADTFYKIFEKIASM